MVYLPGYKNREQGQYPCTPYSFICVIYASALTRNGTLSDVTLQFKIQISESIKLPNNIFVPFEFAKI